ncbi:NADPH-dependent FMN reductase [Paucibacter soli]|uniref:NADPH-dependent FMN reductase n=1 Tax=Paucibacter soli TaxID=3133433 RepID=UPI003098A0F4
MSLLALCGSLRAGSLHAQMLRQAQDLAPAGQPLRQASSLGELPLFNPDLEARPPDAVRRLRDEVAAADGLLIASPEYAHGVSGTLKNALDWLVSFEPAAGMRVGLWSASPRARHADAALRETLKTMSVRIVEPACLSLPLVGAGPALETLLRSPATVQAMQAAMQALADDAPPCAPPWHLRPARPDDAQRLAVVGLQVWLNTYVTEGVSDEVAAYVIARFTSAKVSQLLADAQRHVLVAEGPGGLLGYAQLHLAAPQGEIGTELESLYVQAASHGQGLGRALLAAAMAQAGPLWFSVNARNERALNFYRRAGCIEFGETWFELGQGRYRNLLMRTPLSSDTVETP